MAQSNLRKRNAPVFFAVALVLVGYPAFRMAIAYSEIASIEPGAAAWWSLWGVMLVGHWFCAAIVLAALAGEKASLADIGFDHYQFVRWRGVILIILMAAIFAALFAPAYFYGDAPPERMQSHPLGPVTSAQRVFWIAMAVTAGFVEEIVFRGYAITRLRRFIGLPGAITVSVLSFTFMHGPSAFDPKFAALYIVSGAFFACLFVAMKCKRLEYLVMIHTAIDLTLVAAP